MISHNLCDDISRKNTTCDFSNRSHFILLVDIRFTLQQPFHHVCIVSLACQHEQRHAILCGESVGYMSELTLPLRLTPHLYPQSEISKTCVHTLTSSILSMISISQIFRYNDWHNERKQFGCVNQTTRTNRVFLVISINLANPDNAAKFPLLTARRIAVCPFFNHRYGCGWGDVYVNDSY